jgi:hypothetical protein
LIGIQHYGQSEVSGMSEIRPRNQSCHAIVNRWSDPVSQTGWNLWRTTLNLQSQMSLRISPWIQVKWFCHWSAIHVRILPTRWMKTTILCNRIPVQPHLLEEGEAKPVRLIEAAIISPSILHSSNRFSQNLCGISSRNERDIWSQDLRYDSRITAWRSSSSREYWTQSVIVRGFLHRLRSCDRWFAVQRQ